MNIVKHFLRLTMRFRFMYGIYVFEILLCSNILRMQFYWHRISSNNIMFFDEILFKSVLYAHSK